MLKNLIEIIKSFDVITGEITGHTASQLDEQARNYPEDKINCNIFGVGGFNRNEAGALFRTYRIALIEMMPYNFDLITVDERELVLSTFLFQIYDKIFDKMNANNVEGANSILLAYDRTVLAVYIDLTLTAENSTCL